LFSWVVEDIKGRKGAGEKSKSKCYGKKEEIRDFLFIDRYKMGTMLETWQVNTLQLLSPEISNWSVILFLVSVSSELQRIAVLPLRSLCETVQIYVGKSISKLQMDIELKQEYLFEKYFYFST
jgi:hypothetical protein